MSSFKNLFILMAFLSFLYSCDGQKQGHAQAIGLGLLTVSTQFPISLYKNEVYELPFDTLKFETSKSGKTLFVSGVKLKPYIMSEGESDKKWEEHIKMGLVRFGPELKFCVLDTGESYFRVICNQITKEEFVIRKEPRTFLPFAVTEVKGDWIKVKKGFGREFDFSVGVNYDGWIKWCEGTSLLIDFIEKTYE